MMDDGSLGRHGLGASSSWLDGVPFKIGPKFRPPPKVIYQPVFESSSNVSKEEYTFETEEAVLAWAKAREEALRKASIEQAEKASNNNSSVKNIEEAKDKDENVDNDPTSHSAIKADGNSDSVSFKAKSKPPVAAKPLTPKRLPEPGAILQPTPIQHSNKASNQNENDSVTKISNSVVDVSMFESVADPFDTLELQTLDDMEELKVLLDSASSSNHKKDTSKPENCESNSAALTQNKESSESFYELAAPISRDSWVKFDSDKTCLNNNEQQNLDMLHQDSARSSESPADDLGEYVDISEEKSLNSDAVNGMKKTTPREPDNSEPNHFHVNASPCRLPNLDSRPIYKPVLPPISHKHVKIINGENVRYSSEQSNSVTCTDSMPAASTTSAIPSNNPFVSTNSNTEDCPKPKRVPPLRPPPPIKSSRPAPPTPKPRNSSPALSSPRSSLTNSVDSDSNNAEENTTVKSYMQHHNTNLNHADSLANSLLHSSDIRSDPSPPSVNQLNRYSPLPPAPSLKAKDNIGLSDPYHSLSSEAQEFINRITSMGFLRAKVSRAVQKFGQDEKEVLDHLFAVDLLVEKKYAPVHAEAALQSCKNDIEKAENLLKMQAQLEQLGFSSDSVRDALITSEMDHDKALDLLTA